VLSKLGLYTRRTAEHPIPTGALPAARVEKLA
jgi:hypothetical protein